MSQSERLKYIDDEINIKGLMDIKKVSSEFEVSEKTVKRDVEYLRDRFLAPIQYSKEKKGYIYTDNFTLFKFYDEKNLLFSSFLRKIIENNELIPIVSDKLLKELGKFQSKTYKNLSENILYDLPTHQFPDINVFKIFLESIINRKQCFIKYVNLENQINERYIEPVRIINYSAQWYLLSFCHVKKELRTFSLSRVEKIEITDKKFEYKQDSKRINEYIKNSFGIIKGQPDKENIKNVTIRFYDKAYLILKNQIFHPEQKVKSGELSGVKYADFSFPVSDYREILTKVLQFGENAEVLEPLEFRELWIETIKKMYEKIAK